MKQSEKALYAQRYTGVILAGGRGARMGGQDKGQVQWQGKAMIEYPLACLSQVCKSVVVSANRHIDDYKHIAARFPSLDISIVRDDAGISDIDDYKGPLAGLLAAAFQCRTPYLILLPCDTPQVSTKWLEALLYCHQDSEALICVTHDGQQLQPLHGIFSVESILQTVPIVLAQQKYGFQRWLSTQKYKQFIWPDAQAFLNMNTQQDLEKS